jgi:ubiquinone/menaquinone biosynthesis C-methylase UbiE
MNQRLLQRHYLAALILAPVLLIAGFWFLTDLRKLDLRHPLSRAGWQLPDQVIESLAVRPGDCVADIGAGDGYFTFLLADAVGSQGKVYAVDVQQQIVEKLEASVQLRRIPNVTVQLGEFHDPLLPDGELDLAFFCHSYHHIEDRIPYFQRLRKDLKPGARVCIIDLKPVPLVHLLAPAGHWITEDVIKGELEQAGFHAVERRDFLPGQHFLIFQVAP